MASQKALLQELQMSKDKMEEDHKATLEHSKKQIEQLKQADHEMKEELE